MTQWVCGEQLKLCISNAVLGNTNAVGSTGHVQEQGHRTGEKAIYSTSLFPSYYFLIKGKLQGTHYFRLSKMTFILEREKGEAT